MHHDDVGELCKQLWSALNLENPEGDFEVEGGVEEARSEETGEVWKHSISQLTALKPTPKGSSNLDPTWYKARHSLTEYSRPTMNIRSSEWSFTISRQPKQLMERSITKWIPHVNRTPCLVNSNSSLVPRAEGKPSRPRSSMGKTG